MGRSDMSGGRLRVSRRGLLLGAAAGGFGLVGVGAGQAGAAARRVRAVRLDAPDGSVSLDRIRSANRRGTVLGDGTAGGKSVSVVRSGPALVVPPLPDSAADSVLNGASWLSDNGRLAGAYYDGSGGQHALIWDHPTAAPREVAFGQTHAYGSAVNSPGQLVGFGWDNMGQEGPLAAPYFQDGDQITAITSPPGTYPANHVSGLNDRGTVLMRYGGTEGHPSFGAFLWRPGQPTVDLDKLAADYDMRTGALNRADQVVLGRDSWDGQRVYLFAADTTMTTIVGPGGQASLRDVPRPLNDLGQVAGWYYADRPATHPFLWSGGEFLDLGTLGGENAEAVAVNNRGEVAGTSDVPDGTRRAFLWRRGELIALDPPDATYVSTSAAWLTDQGGVLGYADTADERHTYLWTVS